MNNIHYSYEAYTDLADIKKYITEELASPKAALNTITKITKKIRLLENHAEIGALLSSIIDIETDYRYLVCGNYLSFYRIDNNNIHIIRVLYGKRDYISVLFDEDQIVESDNF